MTFALVREEEAGGAARGAVAVARDVTERIYNNAPIVLDLLVRAGRAASHHVRSGRDLPGGRNLRRSAMYDVARGHGGPPIASGREIDESSLMARTLGMSSKRIMIVAGDFAGLPSLGRSTNAMETAF
jgi:hypothetical protein